MIPFITKNVPSFKFPTQYTASLKFSGNPAMQPSAKEELTGKQLREEHHRTLNLSYWFRAGGHPGRPALIYGGTKYFQPIRDIFANFIKNNQNNNKVLVIGAANGQEPLSYLALTYDALKNASSSRGLTDTINMRILDIKSGIDLNTPNLYTIQSVMPAPPPVEAPLAFNPVRSQYDPPDFDPTAHQKATAWQVKPEIQDYFKDMLERSFWNTDIADITANKAITADDKYKIISCNNVMQYLSKSEQIRALESIDAMLEQGGVLITGVKEMETLFRVHPDLRACYKLYKPRVC